MAIKVLATDQLVKFPEYLGYLANEIKVHWILIGSEGILGLREIFENETSIALVLDYQQGGSLLQEFMSKKTFTEPQTKLIMMQLLLTVDYMH